MVPKAQPRLRNLSFACGVRPCGAGGRRFFLIATQWRLPCRAFHAIVPPVNVAGVAAVALSVAVFAWAYRLLVKRSWKVRLAVFGIFSLLSIPALLFAVYYVHILPETAWFYTLRSWTGSEFLILFAGVAAGAAASLLPRILLGIPLFGLIGAGVLPYLKPVLGPLPDSAFTETWKDGVCMQSTPSTCGPATVSTILKRLGAEASEREAARAAHTYAGGTEAWYLARYVREKGFSPRFVFGRPFSVAAGLPAMVGTQIGGVGHFVAILAADGDTLTIADPLSGEERMTMADFQRRYQFSGFAMVVSPR